jgi:hypothetical protein
LFFLLPTLPVTCIFTHVFHILSQHGFTVFCFSISTRFIELNYRGIAGYSRVQGVPANHISLASPPPISLSGSTVSGCFSPAFPGVLGRDYNSFYRMKLRWYRRLFMCATCFSSPYLAGFAPYFCLGPLFWPCISQYFHS